MSEESPSREVREVELVQSDQASFEGSSYDAGLSLDTTPVSRVEWNQGPDWEQRSAYDAKMMVDTTPSVRPDAATPPYSGTDSDVTAPSDQ
jgi:hypothetical protein